MGRIINPCPSITVLKVTLVNKNQTQVKFSEGGTTKNVLYDFGNVKDRISYFNVADVNEDVGFFFNENINDPVIAAGVFHASGDYPIAALGRDLRTYFREISSNGVHLGVLIMGADTRIEGKHLVLQDTSINDFNSPIYVYLAAGETGADDPITHTVIFPPEETTAQWAARIEPRITLLSRCFADGLPAQYARLATLTQKIHSSGIGETHRHGNRYDSAANVGQHAIGFLRWQFEKLRDE